VMQCAYAALTKWIFTSLARFCLVDFVCYNVVMFVAIAALQVNSFCCHQETFGIDGQWICDHALYLLVDSAVQWGMTQH